jgi:hypothetical protein
MLPNSYLNIDICIQNAVISIHFKKSSPLKQLGQMNRNLVGSIYGRSSVKIAHFVPIKRTSVYSQHKSSSKGGWV